MANQKLGLTRRTCHFVHDQVRRRVLYLTLVRSQFEHCSVIWRPQTKTLTDKLENLQKRAIKWILFEEYTSYSLIMYIQKCRQLNILPLSIRFDFLDILFFYKVTRGLLPVELPTYITPHIDSRRLRSCHLDYLCYTSSITPRSSHGAFAQSFFYRTVLKWNRIPLSIREIERLGEFKVKLRAFLWTQIILDSEDDFISDDVESVWGKFGCLVRAVYTKIYKHNCILYYNDFKLFIPFLVKFSSCLQITTWWFIWTNSYSNCSKSGCRVC